MYISTIDMTTHCLHMMQTDKGFCKYWLYLPIMTHQRRILNELSYVYTDIIQLVYRQHKTLQRKYNAIDRDVYWHTDTNTNKHTGIERDHQPYLTLFHADINLALSLSTSSGSVAASGPTASLRAGLPVLWLSSSSSCSAPPTYCTALGDTEFMAPGSHSWAALVLLAMTVLSRRDQRNKGRVKGVHQGIWSFMIDYLTQNHITF